MSSRVDTVSEESNHPRGNPTTATVRTFFSCLTKSGPALISVGLLLAFLFCQRRSFNISDLVSRIELALPHLEE